MADTILDAFLDTLKIFPFLLIIYILIELLEHKSSFLRDHERLQGNLAPLIGAATGLVPQCGFSVMAAKLYDKGLIRTGTILAVFLATSDEAFIILFSEGMGTELLYLIVVKLVVAVLAGYAANLILTKEKTAQYSLYTDADGYSCGREHEGKSDIQLFLVQPLLHSLKISLYILLVNLILGCIIYEIGEDNITTTVFIGGAYFQPFISSAIGLIPNCAASVIIAEAYHGGFMTFGSCAAGLCANAGLGFVVLLKNRAKLKRTLALIAAVYLISVAVGVIINSIQLLTGDIVS